MFHVKPTKLSQIDEIKINFQDDTIEVSVFVEAGTKGELAIYNETLQDKDLPQAIRDHAQHLGKLLLQELGKRRERPAPCTTCRGACCYSYEEVHVTGADLRRMAAAGIDPDDKVVKLFERETLSGFAGVLRQKPRKISGKKEDGACVFLRDDGCSIYDHRPDVCREYDAFTCDTFGEDRKKVEGKVKLRVLQGAKG
jgi:Fe-S-cluster containining protein